MVRTQIILEEEMYRQIKYEAFLHGKSMAATIRNLLAVSLSREAKKKPSKKKYRSSKDFSFIGSASMGKVDNISERHDEELGKGRW